MHNLPGLIYNLFYSLSKMQSIRFHLVIILTYKDVQRFYLFIKCRYTVR